MRRGDLWLADVGGKPRPVLVVTRDEVIDAVCGALAIALGCGRG